MGDIPSHYLRQLENKINKFYSVLQYLITSIRPASLLRLILFSFTNTLTSFDLSPKAFNRLLLEPGSSIKSPSLWYKYKTCFSL